MLLQWQWSPCLCVIHYLLSHRVITWLCSSPQPYGAFVHPSAHCFGFILGAINGTNGKNIKKIIWWASLAPTHQCFHCKGLIFVQHDFSCLRDLRSDLTWKIKSVISWKTTMSCISKGHPLAFVHTTQLTANTHTYAHTRTDTHTQHIIIKALKYQQSCYAHMLTYSYEGICKKQTVNCR